MQAFETKLKFEELKTYLDVVKFNMRKFSIIGADNENLRWVMSAETKQHIESEVNNIIKINNNTEKTRLMGVKILIDDELPLGEIKLFSIGGVI